MGESTISMAIFNSYLYAKNYQRVKVIDACVLILDKVDATHLTFSKNVQHVLDDVLLPLLFELPILSWYYTSTFLFELLVFLLELLARSWRYALDLMLELPTRSWRYALSFLFELPTRSRFYVLNFRRHCSSFSFWFWHVLWLESEPCSVFQPTRAEHPVADAYPGICNALPFGKLT